MSDQHETHHVNYLYVFFALCCFTAMSVVMDLIQIESKAVLATIVLSISVCKALCVMMYFMHLKFEGNWKYVLLAPTTILAIGLPLAILPDIGLHYYLVDVPQHETTLSHGEGHSHALNLKESESSEEKTAPEKKH
jgi:caa(3)-type oxidase subunit IV